MNKALLQRQMFREGGAAVPNQYKGFSKLPEEVQMKMNPELAKKYEQGGEVFNPNNIYNIVRFFRDNPGTTVEDYNRYFGTNLDPEEFKIFERPAESRNPQTNLIDYPEGGFFLTRPDDLPPFDPRNTRDRAMMLQQNPGMTMEQYDGIFGIPPKDYEEPVGTMGAIRLGDQIRAPGTARLAFTTEGTGPQEQRELREQQDIDEAIEVGERGVLPIIGLEEGGVAGLMRQPDMASMPMGQASNQLDPNMLASTLGEVAQDTGDLEQAPDFQSMMNQFSGEDKSEEERRDDLASIVGPEDAAQTPDSVLALVTPVVQLSMVEEGIAPMAREAMDTPVQGDMAGGIMSMTGAGNEPPENFKYGGEVRRRGDEDPVLKFSEGKGVPTITPMTDFKMDLGSEIEKLKPVFEKYMPTTDPETRRNQLQSDILFDIANTALAFSAPMQNERPGMSAAERIALATQNTQLLPKIQQRTAKSVAEAKAEEKAPTAAAIQAAINFTGKKLEAIKGERLESLKIGGNLITQSIDIAAKKNAATAAFDREKILKDLQNKLAINLEQIKQRLKFGYDKELANLANTIEQEQIKLTSELKIVENEKKHENAIDLFNKESVLKKDMQKITQVHEIAKLNKEIESREGIAAANNQTKLTINSETNKLKKYIADNRLEFDEKTLTFNKLQEQNKLNQLSIENSLNAQKLQLDKDKFTEEKTQNDITNTLNSLKFEETQLQNSIKNEQNQQTINLSKKRLEEIDAVRVSLEKLKTLDGIAFNKEKIKLEKMLAGHKIKYENSKLQIDERLAGVKSFLATLENSKFLFQKQANNLTKFGNSLDAKTLAIISDKKTIDNYAKGGNSQSDANINALVTDYLTPKDVWNPETNRYEKKTNKLPTEFINAMRSRSNIAGAILPPGVEAILKKGPDTTEKTEEPNKFSFSMQFGDQTARTNLNDINVPQPKIDFNLIRGTGSPAFIKNAFNIIAEATLPLVGITTDPAFTKTKDAATSLKQLNTQFIQTFMRTYVGKDSVKQIETLESLTAEPASFFTGDATAKSKIDSILKYIDNALVVQTTKINFLPQGEKDYADTATKIVQLKQLKYAYKQFSDAYAFQGDFSFKPQGIGRKIDFSKYKKKKD